MDGVVKEANAKKYGRQAKPVGANGERLADNTALVADSVESCSLVSKLGRISERRVGTSTVMRRLRYMNMGRMNVKLDDEQLDKEDAIE